MIEDSRAGIQAGLKAGMRVLAVATTYPASQLTDAHLVLPTLDGVGPADLERRLFWPIQVQNDPDDEARKGVREDLERNTNAHLPFVRHHALAQ